MFTPVDPSLDLVALEERVLARWRETDPFSESLRRRSGATPWVFYDGPPTANGRPGIHHVWARLFKDIYPRFQTMRGRYVERKGGWDCHGLPVEVEVEKELGFSGKQQIEDFGIEAFNERCRSSVQRYVEDWQSLTGRIGMWLDTADAYWTMSNEFVESVWWIFHEMWTNNDIYEGFKVVPYCGRCGTALSSHELGQPGAYRDITEDSVYVRFPVVGSEYDLVVWTTTPWTLPSNVAAAVGPDIDYVRVADPAGGRDLVLAAARVEDVLGPEACVLGPISVGELVGVHYERPFTLLELDERASVVLAADFVTVDDGSGIVHLAPAFGEIDREVSEAHGLPLLNPVDATGRFDTSMPPPYRGVFVKHADADLIADLQTLNRAVRVAPHTHSYPHCWRCSTPLIYWAKPTWFARTSEHRDAMLRENETVTWHPEHIKHGRFGKWLEGNVDWALSRDRFWGTPIPVWRCVDCGHDTCFGSIAALAERADQDLGALDLHRPYVDDVVTICSECGGRQRRVEPVLDAWFDSGSMPTAQFHFPFADAARTVGDGPASFPADFICEAIDQTRGWFYSLLAVNTLVFQRAPYRNVVCLAHIVDEDGLKMSKSVGNVIDPWSVLNTRGADALRWNMFSAGSPWTSKRVFLSNIDDSTRQFIVTLWNVYSFFVTYASLDGWSPGLTSTDPPTDPSAPAHVLDRWARSRVNSTVRTVTEALEAFDALRGAAALEALVDDLSNWYVRRSRPRFWKQSDAAAHRTLYDSLVTITQLLAPFCPFLTEEMFANLTGSDQSVHLEDWPTVDERTVDSELERSMAHARKVVSLGRAARTEAKIGVRQPLRRASVLVPDGERLDADVIAEIATELNVKLVDELRSLEGFVSYAVVPNFKVLGPLLGPKMPAGKAAIAAVDGGLVRRAFDAGESFPLVIDGLEVELTPDNVEVRVQANDDLSLVQDGAFAVALDLTVTDELRREGLGRELVRLINDVRKTKDLDISARIDLTITIAAPAPAASGENTGQVHGAAIEHGAWIASEVLATTHRVVAADGTQTEEPNARLDDADVWIDISVLSA